MSQTTVKVQLQQRYDTSGNFTSANPTLLSGEIGWESDTKKYKIGDGSTAWTSLAYPSGAGGYTAGTGVSISASNVITASAIALTQVFTAANQTAHLALTTQEGDVVVRSDENKSYVRNSGSASDMTDYTLLATPTDAVLSVNGNTGAITADQLAAAIESATDSNTFSDADHTKLNGVAASANNYAISTDLLDEDNFATNSATKVPSQQSTKAYVDTADALKANLSGATYTGNIVLDNAKEIRLSETDANGSHYLGFKAPDSVTANVTFTLPDGAGSNGQYLQSSGSGTLSWASASSNSASITVADESSDTSCNVAFFTAATGDLAPKTGTNLTFNSSTGELTATKLTDDKGDVRTIVQNTQAGAYTLVAADAGKHILASGNITWADSTFTAGMAVTIVNNTAGDLTITKGTNMYNTADGTNTNRTLGTRGMATLLFTATDSCYISGSPLS